MPSDTLTLAIVGHLVGDYLLQNDWMALNKKKQCLPLLVHVVLWTQSVMLFTGWMFLPWQQRLAVIVILTFTHAVQDHTDVVTKWMDLIGQRQFRTGPCTPWSIIVVDNVWHIVTLWAVWKFIV